MKLVSVFFVPVSLLLMANTSNPWTTWERELSRSCPGRHVELMGDGAYDEFLGAFYRTLTPTEKRRMSAVANYKRACATETNGFSCEMSRNISAAQKLGLLHKVVAFGCRTVKCEEGALCSQFPAGPTY